MLLPQSGEKLFSLSNNLMNFDSQPQIHFFYSHTLRYSENLRLLFQDNIRPDIVKSPAGYRTGHLPEMRPDTGPDLLSGTPLVVAKWWSQMHTN